MTSHLDLKQLINSLKLAKVGADESIGDGEFNSAIDILSDAVDTIDRSNWDSGGESLSGDEKLVAFYLADFLGMIGGNYRRMGLLEKAFPFFQRGSDLEKTNRFEIDSSYNLVNAITFPIEMGTNTASGQKDLLRAAIETLESQTRRNRRTMSWAWADLGECRMLLGDLVGAKEAYQRFIDLGNSDATQSSLKKLRKLKEALSRVKDDTKVISQCISLLEES